MAGPNTPVLNMEITDAASHTWGYNERLDTDRAISQSLNQVDAAVGHLTASCYSIFCLSGNMFTQLATPIGVEYTRDDRVLQEVVAWASTSGSGGVTTIDVQVQQGSVAPANFSTVFVNNNAARPGISASLGNYGLAKSSNFVSGSNTRWPAGTLLKVVALTSAGDGTALNAQTNVTVQVFYKPTGSYGV